MKVFLAILSAGLLIAGITGSSEKQTKSQLLKKIVAKDTSSYIKDIEPILI